MTDTTQTPTLCEGPLASEALEVWLACQDIRRDRRALTIPEAEIAEQALLTGRRSDSFALRRAANDVLIAWKSRGRI